MKHLDASLHSELDWEVNVSESATFFLDFGWDTTPFDPANPLALSNAMLAAEEFIKRRKDPCHVVLFQSNGEFSKYFARLENTDELYSADLMSHYLHLIASVLLDEMVPTLVFDISTREQFPELVLRLCRRRFEHFHLKFSNIAIPIEGEAPICICLPQDALYTPQSMEPLFTALTNQKYICIPEELLNEHWDGLDEVIYDPETIGEVGKRMLEGFEAAGGKCTKKSQILENLALSE